MKIIKKILKLLLIFISIILILMVLFFANMVFTLVREGDLYWHSEDVIYENWHIRLPENGEEIYYTDSGASFHGDGQRYSVYEYSKEEIINKAFPWKNKKDKNIETEIKEVVEQLKEQDVEIPEKYKIDLNKKYEYMVKTKDDNSKLYLVHIIGENKIYLIEKIY